jgi:beta-galactosidase GanA
MAWFVLLLGMVMAGNATFALTSEDRQEADRLLMDVAKKTRQPNREREVVVFQNGLGPGWDYSTWRNLDGTITQNKTLVFTQNDKTTKWCGVFFKNLSGQNILTLADKNKLSRLVIVAELKTSAITSFQVALSALKKNGKYVNTKYRPLTKEIKENADGWTTLEISLDKFRNITNLDAIRGIFIQYTKSPRPGLTLEFKSIRLEDRGKDLAQSTGKITIKPFDLPEDYRMVEQFWPDRAANIRVAGPRLTRQSTPFFLTGVEGQVFMFPWLYRLMNYDMIHLGDTYFNWFAHVKKTAGGVEFSFAPQPWTEVQFRELLTNGIALYVQPVEGSSVLRNPHIKKLSPDALTNSSHFIGFRFDNETGRALRHNFWKSIFSVSRKYPVTILEFFNELRYCDYSPANLADFKRAMAIKYGTIGNANDTWKTSFASFDHVTPPKKLTSYAYAARYLEPSNPSMPLWVDWGRFIEKRLTGHIRDLKDFVRKYDKNPNLYCLIQSTSDLDQDYTGLIGVYPPYKRAYEDVFGLEMGMTQYPQSEGSENPEELNLMLKGPFAWEMLRDLNQDSPVLAVESIPRSGIKEYSEASCVVDLHGAWRFSPEKDTVNLKSGANTISFNDSSWKKISVPGVWGDQGFPDCTVGWYRKTFVVPQSRRKKKLFLVGSELADKAEIYLNGEFLRTTHKWSEKFCIDIATKINYGKPNILAIKIANNYRVEGKMQGGIRKLIAVSADQCFEQTPMTPGEFRNYLWSLALHGVSGSIMSYAYSSDGRRHSLYSPSKYAYETVRTMPKVPLEINSVASMIFPERRRTKSVMFVYPFETGRGRLVPPQRSWFRGDVTMDILNYYSAAYFDQFDVGVTCNERILEGSLSGVKVLFLLNSPRVMNGIPEKLESFVGNGGILILDAESMTINDDTHRKIETPAWLGITPGAAITTADEISTLRHRDNTYGTAITLAGARPLVKNAAGEPVVTVHNYKKGKVYYFARHLKQALLRGVIKDILISNGVKQAISLQGSGYISAHKLTAPGRVFWYLYNWGGGDKKVAATAELPAGSYRLRDIVSGSVVQTGITSGETLQLTLKSHDPVILLFERDNVKPLKLQKLSANHRQFLSWWRKSPTSKHKILFCGAEDEGVCKSRIITGVHLLEEHGYQTETGQHYRGAGTIDIAGEDSPLRLADFSVIALTNPRIANKPEWREALKKYVEDGGSVFLSANQHEGPHNWWNSRNMRELFGLFNVKTGKNISDQKTFHFDHRFPAFSIDPHRHPILAGCTKLQSKGMAELLLNGQDVLIRSNPTSTPANVPIMTAFEFGKGRVVIMGDSKWMLPQYLNKGDNAQLMLNIFNWLSRRPVTVEPKDQIQKRINPQF